MSVWSGLGYYSRARRLWEAARKVMNIIIKPTTNLYYSFQLAISGHSRYSSRSWFDARC